MNSLKEILNSTRGYDPVLSIVEDCENRDYTVDSSILEDFFCRYCSEVYLESNKNSFSDYSENIPLSVELDFHFYDDTNDPQYIFSHTFEKQAYDGIVECMRNLLYTTKKHEKCIILYSDIEKGNMKIRFQFPYCKISKSYYNDVFRKEILRKFTNENLLGSMEVSPSNGLKEILKTIDLLKMFGNKYKYFINHSNFNVKEILDAEVITSCEDLDKLNESAKLEFLIPILTSSLFTKENVKIKNGEKKQQTEFIVDEEDPCHIEKKILFELIDLLDESRWNDKIYFKDIGKAIQTTFECSEEGLEYWKQITSEKSSEFSERDCIELYYYFSNHGITVKTIAWFASHDNPKLYKQWHNKWINEALKTALNEPSDFNVAEAIFRKNWLDIINAEKKWYYFEGHTLKLTSTDGKLMNTIMSFETFLRAKIAEYTVIAREKQARSVSRRDEEARSLKSDIKDLDAKCQSLMALAKKMGNITTANKYIKALPSIFSRKFQPMEPVRSYINTNINTLGMPNGVLEMDYWGKKGEGGDGRVLFRPGKPEDYITKRMGISYRPDLTEDSPEVKEAYKYYEQVFPDPEQREFQYIIFGDMILGGNSDKFWHIWTGKTNGSKSIRQMIEETMFGDYAVTLPPETYSAKSRGSGPTPETAQLAGARIAYSTEADDDEPVKGARIKRVTGGDRFFSRNCNEDGGSVVPTHKPVMVLNSMPPITGFDEAVVVRFLLQIHASRWVGKSEDDYEKVKRMTDEERMKNRVFIKDDTIAEKKKIIAAGLLYICIKYFPISRQRGIDPPKSIRDEIYEYWSKHDFHVQFIKQQLVKTGSEDDQIDIEELYKHFKHWFRRKYPKEKIEDQNKFEEMMSEKNRLGKNIKDVWYGYKFKQFESPKEKF